MCWSSSDVQFLVRKGEKFIFLHVSLLCNLVSFLEDLVHLSTGNIILFFVLLFDFSRLSH